MTIPPTGREDLQTPGDIPALDENTMPDSVDAGQGETPPTPDDPVATYRDRFEPLVTTAVLRFKIRPEIAVELVQNVFTRFFSGKYSPTNVKPWLAKALARECVEFKGRASGKEEPFGGLSELPDDAHDPTAQLDRQILVGQAIGNLEHRSREVLRLHYLQGFTAREIAERIGTTESYVENLISKGLREAKAALVSRKRQRP